MYQKGIKMNYLWIKQVSGIISILENIFLSNLLILFILWAASINSRKLGITFINIRDSFWLFPNWLGGGLIWKKPEGLFIKMDMAKGYGGLLAVGRKSNDKDQRLISPEPVFYHSGRISNQCSILKDLVIWSQPTDPRSTTMIFDHDGAFDIQSWALITGSTARAVSPLHDHVHAGTGLRHPTHGGRPTGEQWLLRGYEWDEYLIDGLMCYGSMYYIGREVGGYMIDLIWYLSVIILSYLLGTLTNSKPNQLHDKSNLLSTYYNLILSLRNSNLSLFFQ
jgi:hypothetical protein